MYALMHKKKNNKGFTLIELIVVVAILAILAAVAVPAFVGIKAEADKGVALNDASAIAGAINVKNAMGGSIKGDSGWTKGSDITTIGTLSAMTTALGDLAPTMTSGHFDKAIAMVWVNANGVAAAGESAPSTEEEEEEEEEG